VYFIHSEKEILEINIGLTKNPFQKHKIQSGVAFLEVYFATFRKHYFGLWKDHFGSKNYNL